MSSSSHKYDGHGDRRLRDTVIHVRTEKNGRQYHLNRYDVHHDLPWSGSVLTVGQPNSGKSNTITVLMYYRRGIAKWYVICSNTSYLGKGVHPSTYRKEYSKQVARELQEIMRKQTEVTDMLKLRAGLKVTEEYKWTKQDMREHGQAILIDDMSHDDKLFNSPELRELINNCRHMGILLFMCVHYAYTIPKKLRGNLRVVLFTQEPSEKNRELISSSYFGIYPSFRDFDDVAKQVWAHTEFNLLVLDKSARSLNPNKATKHWRPSDARKLPGFYVGCRPYREAAKRARDRLQRKAEERFAEHMPV